MSKLIDQLNELKQQTYSLEITTSDGQKHHCENHWDVQEFDGKLWILYSESKGKVQYFNLSQATSLNFNNFNS